MEALEFCDTCFARGRTNLCETYKNTFTKTNPLHFSQQAKLDRILNSLGQRPQLIDRRWTCIVDSDKRDDFLNSLWGIGVSVHTLEDHVKVLSKFYKPQVNRLGESTQIEISSLDSWEEFNPKSRSWDPLKVNKKNDKFFVKTNLGNVLRYSNSESETSYFRTNLSEGIPTLIQMERRAALNIICSISEPSSANWKTDDAGLHGFIENKDLENIPEEISNILQRLGTRDKRIPEMLTFDINDFGLVKTTLEYIKINLVESTKKVSYVADAKSDMPIPIEKIQKERLDVFLHIVMEMGGIIDTQKDNLSITGKRGAIKVVFLDADKSSQDGTEIRISLSGLENPSRFAEIINLIKKRLGLLDLPLESMISQFWPIITDSDLQYIVQSATSWWSNNPTLAVKIIGDNDKFKKIKEWHSKIKEGKVRSSLDTITLGKIIKQKESKLETK